MSICRPVKTETYEVGEGPSLTRSCDEWNKGGKKGMNRIGEVCAPAEKSENGIFPRRAEGRSP